MKKIAKAIVSMGVVLAFAGCSWQIPQTVSVKTNADYSFSLGNFTNDLGDSMDTDSMMGDSSAEGITKYDYFPGKSNKNVQHYLLEKEVLISIVPANQIESVFGSATSKDAGTINISSLSNAVLQGLDFNPSTMLAEMKSSFGNDIADKIAFKSVPMYLYCETTPGLTAEATINMCYGDKSNSINKRDSTELTVLDDTLTTVPKPNYQLENNTVVTNLANVACLGGQPTEIKTLVNSNDASIEEDDQLCIEYQITGLSGTIQKADAINGISIRLYAVIDLPVEFQVSNTADVSLDVNKMSGESDDSSSSSSESSSSSGDSEFSKYLNVMKTVSIKYVVYQLPIYAANGMSLKVDLIGDGSWETGSEVKFIDKNKTITDDDKSSINLHTETIQKMKANANFKPNFVIFLKRGSVFSLPREKMIDMNLEMSFTTDGTIQVK
jgi:hypothetical protein